jgi:hypothetical protein
MTRFSKLAAALAVLPIMAFASPVLADSPGQLETGSFVYQVKDVTTSGTYGNSINVSACDEVQYRVWLHNTEFGNLSNVTAMVNLPSASSTTNTSTMTATTDLGGTSGTNGSATVNVGSAQTVSYENGSSVLFNQSGNVIKSLPDTITGSGVNIGTLNGSTTEYITFKAKVSCPVVTPPVVSFACTELDVTNIDRTHFDFTAKASVSNATVTSYGFTAKDANGNTVDTTTVTTNALSALYHFNQTNAGTYTVSAVVNTDHGSTSASACSKQVTVAAVPTTPATPAATVLPNTGAGDVLGIFGGASAAGTAAHAIVTRRRRGL